MEQQNKDIQEKQQDMEKETFQENPQKTENDELKKCNLELKNLKDACVRIAADFENYKKRVEKEKHNWVEEAQAELISDLLNIVDDFDRALSTQQQDQNLELWLAGFKMIHKSLYKLLESYNVKEVKDNLEFNPEYHEAIMQVESDKHESGQIVAVLQKGFIFKEKVLRPAKVSVAK